jgi:hypothetical protein
MDCRRRANLPWIFNRLIHQGFLRARRPVRRA